MKKSYKMLNSKKFKTIRDPSRKISLMSTSTEVKIITKMSHQKGLAAEAVPRPTLVDIRTLTHLKSNLRNLLHLTKHVNYQLLIITPNQNNKSLFKSSRPLKRHRLSLKLRKNPSSRT